MLGWKIELNQSDEPLFKSIREFVELKPPVFTRASKAEDPLLLLDKNFKALNALECSSTRSLELVAYCLQDIACNDPLGHFRCFSIFSAFKAFL